MLNIENGYKYIGVIKNAIQKSLPARIPLLQGVRAPKLAPLAEDTFAAEQSVPLLERSEEQIKAIIKKTLSTKFIGHGAEAKVYKIPGFDYVLRVHKGSKPDFNSKISFDVSKKDRINHYVAKMGDNVEIAEYIDGENVCCLTHNFNKMPEKQHNINLKILEMPISAYENFLKTIFDAAKSDMAFDFAGRNIIADFSNKKFVPIDFEYGFSKNPRQQVFNPILCMQSGFSVREPDLQFKFIEKVLNGYGQLAKSGYDFTLPNCKFEPALNMMPFNLVNIPLKPFAADVQALNKYIQNVANTKAMHSQNPMFMPRKAVFESVDELSSKTAEFVKKYTG